MGWWGPGKNQAPGKNGSQGLQGPQLKGCDTAADMLRAGSGSAAVTVVLTVCT